MYMYIYIYLCVILETLFSDKCDIAISESVFLNQCKFGV